LFECQNPNCAKQFHYAAKYTVHQYSKPEVKEQIGTIITVEPIVLSTIEEFLCPFCKSKEFTEYIPPTPTQEEIANVYIYDLTSGAQTALDALLAQGYRIQQRYAKQYFLEKPKTSPIEANDVQVQITEDPSIPKGTFRITTSINGKPAVFNNCQLAENNPETQSNICVNIHERVYRGCTDRCKEYVDCKAKPAGA